METLEVKAFMKSYVIFDLETTTLPCYGKSKITEISVIAVVRDHIIHHKDEAYLPRVLNKLTLCLYPQRIISLDAEKLTGLSNCLLEDQTPFNDNTFNILNDFIVRMPKPVCLIAHNGICFDFPILQAEVQSLGKKFPDDLWCADSLPAFRFLYSDKPAEKVPVVSQAIQSSGDNDIECMFICDDDGFDSELCEVLDIIENTGSQKKGNGSPASEISPLKCDLRAYFTPTNNLPSPSSIKNMQKVNETTPKRPLKKNTRVKLEKNEKDSMLISGEAKKFKKGPVKSLAQEFSGKKVNCPKSFKLIDIYQHLCKRLPLDAHNAESDVIMLLQSIIASKDEFLDWVDKNAKCFNTMKKAW